jgi:acyl-[acyl carrier protein]--UDP-N-acetylglucosamine O-acyltransferase
MRFTCEKSMLVAGLNIIGLRRSGMTAAERSGLKKTLKTFFFKGLNFGNAAKEMENADFKNKYTDRFCEFMASTKRGVLSPDPEVLAAAMRGADENEE